MPPPDWLALAAAPLIGSFAATLAWRLPANWPEFRAFALGRSVCDGCGAPLGVPALIPLIGFAVAGGRCRTCGTAIGWFHPLVELAAIAIAASAMAVSGGAALWLGCAFGWTLTALAAADQRHMLLPDWLTLPLTLAGLIAVWGAAPNLVFDHVIGAAVGFGALTLIALLYRRLRGRDGLGLGDAKLLAAGGAWIGWQGLAPSLLIGCISALACALIGALIGGRALRGGDSLPFGPHLCLGIWLYWLYLAAIGAAPLAA